MEKYRAIGLMSGSSLDGLDIACCDFIFDSDKWSFETTNAEVINYPQELLTEIKALPTAGAKTFWETHTRLGNFFGEQVKNFISRHLVRDINLVSSHGHTVFHFPEKHFTTQIGDGSAIAAQSGLPVVCDFRSMDIACGGQGTPIVPIGDLLLFKGYKFCLNIGGIANISCKLAGSEKNIVAFDICAANQVLNALANNLGAAFDAGGKFAQSGKLNDELLNALNQLTYYQMPYPKSLDNSFSSEMVLPILQKSSISTEDKLHTYTEHIAQQLAKHIKTIMIREKPAFNANDKMLVTGGGALNTFLIKRLKMQTGITIEVPSQELIKFKEAIVIAFMGVLRLRNQVNVLKSVTNAYKDTVGGAVYLP
jgi:anhydro-N-acetylmuramic acid kinase